MKKLENKTDNDIGNSPTVSLVMSKDMHEQLIDEAWRQKTTKSELIRRFISEGLKYVPRSKCG